MTGVAVLERIPIVTPLGVRFRDEATRNYVSDSISAVLYPADSHEQRIQGFPTTSGVYIFSGLPGLRSIEHGDGDDAFWSAQTPRFGFVLEVRDLAGRYLPFSMPILVPQRGVFGMALDGSAADSLPLFSSSARVVPDGMGVLRAELIDAAGGPAAWAIVEARAGEQRLVTGLADRDGRVTLPLLYPKPVITLGSPATQNTPLTEQQWRVDLTVRYRRREPVPDIPDLVDILTQPPADAWLETSPLTRWSEATLRFGRELVPETADGVRMATVLMTP